MSGWTRFYIWAAIGCIAASLILRLIFGSPMS